MKNLTMNMTIAAAAFVAVAGVASAQTMEANIPFAFRAGGKVLAPGTYRVKMDRGTSGMAHLLIRSVETGAGSFALLAPGNQTKHKTGEAVLKFECGSGRCTLDEVWNGASGAPSYRVPAPSLGRDEERRVTEIVMHAVKSE